jgi:nucleoside-diphosphate-sugar epimerase
VNGVAGNMTSRMRVLVTGSSGFIGAVMVPMLESEGFDVTRFDLGLYEDCRFMGSIPAPDHRDLRTVTATDLAGHDAVIHLAGLSNDPVGNLDPSLTIAINHQGSVRLADAAKQAGVQRFLFSSSCSLYGAHGSTLVDEHAPFAPVTAYAESKVLTEQYLAGLADDEFSPTYLRNATVYGPSPALRLDLVVNNLTASAVTTGNVHLESDGSPWRPQIHVEDVCRAFVAALRAPREVVHDEAFNVGIDAENYQIREIAEMVAEEVPGSKLTFAADAGPDTRSYRVTFRKLAETLDFGPRWTVRAGIGQLASLYRQQGLTADGFDRYLRLAEIRRRLHDGTLAPDLTVAA